MVGYMAWKQGFLPTNDFARPDYQKDLAECVKHLSAALVFTPDGKMLLEGIDYSQQLAAEETGRHASFIAKDPKCRQLLSEWQRQLAQHLSPQGVVIEGRDMGTVVFPSAPLKFFLTCDLATKTQRRWHELYPHQQPTPSDLQKMSDLLSQRDQRDKARKIAPLKPADDAYVIDTTHRDVNNVVGCIVAKIHEFARST